MPETPEQKARREIDEKLRASGWKVQDRGDLDLSAGPGIAITEFPMKSGHGTADYLLYIDGKAAGAVEAKAQGALTGVEAQSAKYSEGLPDNLPAHRRPLPFLFESNGKSTQFTNGLDPTPRSRLVYSFPRPETLADLVEQSDQLRSRLRKMPPLDESRLWSAQAEAIRNLEESFAESRPRALIQMATGSGKTFTAVNICYRLLKYSNAKRILFLVDRSNLGKQAEDEFAIFEPPDDPRKFPELYTVQRMKSNAVNPAAKIVITTIQRLFSILKGDPEFDEGNEEGSGWDTAKPFQGPPPEVVYNPAIPPEFFDFIIVDECHRSIYDLWSQVLLYFDSFLIGLTATPGGKTIGFFNQNLVQQYNHTRAVVDGVNVGFDVYRIRTKITEQGATVEAGVYVDKRHKLTRAERLEYLNQDFTYTANQLDRDVVSETQIRTVIRAFKDRALPETFPDREEVPKTLIFAKDDSHADDIVRIVREEFGEGNDFCQKITYRTGQMRVTKTVIEDGKEVEITEWKKVANLTPDELIQQLRLSFYPRIAVTVDLISTGTDVKPLEVIMFLRNVRSAGFFEQMKGRGVRVITPDKLKSVSPTATRKERFIIVDAVGVCEQDKTESGTLNRQPSVSLEKLLEYVAQGGTDEDALVTLAGRIANLQHEFTPAQTLELRELGGGKTLSELANGLLEAFDPDAQIEAAKSLPGVVGAPTDEQIKKATEKLVKDAVTPFHKAAFRRRILEIRAQNEQVIDRHSIDELLYSGIDAAAIQKAASKVEDLRQWIRANRDELTALQAIYSGTKKLNLTLKDLRQLRDALLLPPVKATPSQLWQAFQAVEGAKVKGRGGNILTDLVAIVRHAMKRDESLVPYADQVKIRYTQWLEGKSFTSEEREWLDRIADHIATSLRIEPEDFDIGWFAQHGSLGKAHLIFGGRLQMILKELNDRLAA